MARETAKQRNERLERERQEKEAQIRANWYPRLVNAMARAHKLGFHLASGEGKLSYTNQHTRDSLRDTFMLDTEYSPLAQTCLEALEFELSWQEQKFEEEQRQMELRRAALAKLSDEEREALGL